ncbi:MAG: hypothetical protein ACR2LC_17560 [Pyrinomonadaceae bacterium]
MAGWDGDALAGQMEEAMERQQEAAEARLRKKTVSREDLSRAAEIESLRLSKARIQNQLERATNPAHRAMLERALAAIESQMSE